MALEFAERIRRIPVYPVAAGYDLGEDMAMLASNETSVRAAGGGQRGRGHGAGRQPPLPGPRLRAAAQALSDRYGLAPERIALGSGSCDILLAAGEALLEPGAELVYAWPAFSVYPHLGAASGARAIEVPLDSEERHDLDAMLAEITVATRLVLICNPNNPTSTALALEEIEQFLKRVPPHVCVILDEAYCEFSLALGDTYASLELLDRYPNLVLLRTFSKVYGLAGLRVGYALCGDRQLPDRGRPGAPAVLPDLRRAGGGGRGAAPPGRGGAAGGRDDRLPRHARSTASASSACGSRRATPTSSGSAFRDEDDGADRRGAARSRRAGPRGLGARRPGCVRVTVGTDAENERFVSALRANLLRATVAAALQVRCTV